MEQNKKIIISALKERNAKELFLKELIVYSNRLLSSLDLLQKETVNQKMLSEQIEKEYLSSSPDSKSLKPSESELLAKCFSLQRQLDESYSKISGYTDKIIELKNTVDDKNILLSNQNATLVDIQKKLESFENLCKDFTNQVAALKSLLQDKTDECDVLNMAYSSIENRKNDLEIENKKLLFEIEKLKLIDYSAPIAIDQLSEKTANQIPSDEHVADKVNLTHQKIPSTCTSPTFLTNNDWFSSKAILPDKIKQEFTAHDSEINAVVWFPDFSFITAGSDRKVKLWKIQQRDIHLEHSLRGCNAAILSAELNLDSSLLLCSSADFASRVWTVSDFTIRHTFTGHSGKVTSSKFVGETNKIVSASADETLKLWDLRQRVCLVTYTSHSQVNDLVISDNNLFFSGHTDKKIRFWDTRSNNPAAQVETFGSVTSLDSAKKSNLFLASERGNKIELYDLRNYKVVNSLQDKNFEIGSSLSRSKFSPDAQYCCCGSKNGSVLIWNVASTELEKELKGHSSNVLACSWSPCGNYLVSCDSAKKCILWVKR